jgi:dihydrolipoamide dehydrogenase
LSDFDVLGAAPRGDVAAIRASQLSLQAAVIESKYRGGVCLNVVYIPSKALLKNAELAHTPTHDKDKHGIVGDATMEFGPTHARSHAVADRIVMGVPFLMTMNKVREINAWGIFTGPKTVESLPLCRGDLRSATIPCADHDLTSEYEGAL